MTDRPTMPPAIRLGWVFYAALGLATGPGIYALQHGNTFAAVGYAALAGLWYIYGGQSVALYRSRAAVGALLSALQAQHQVGLAAAKNESARLSAPDNASTKGPA